MIDEKNEPSAGSATLFQMLARGLTCPDAAMVEAIEDGSFAAEVGELLACMPFSESLAERVERSLEDLSCTIGDPDFLASLRREYTRLFSAPRGALVPPWETLFLNADEDAPEFGSVLIRSKEAADARNRYEAVGFSWRCRNRPTTCASSASSPDTSAPGLPRRCSRKAGKYGPGISTDSSMRTWTAGSRRFLIHLQRTRGILFTGR